MPQSESTPERFTGSGRFTDADDRQLIEALRRGDDDAFAALIEQHHAALVRLAIVFVGSHAVAEEVAQETWLAVLRGLDRFEGRSSLKTWIFSILGNRARSRNQRERRSVPFSALALAEESMADPAVEPERFRQPGERWAGGWVSFPRPWGDLPEDRLVGQETRAHLKVAITALPPAQREVICLRDVEGLGAEAVCNILGISETNQRVLLHRARSKVRRALAAYLGTE
ncbi:MAG TPA: RNA polymerase sigma factor [Chloroflexota bacterium]|nr:RNA polymerase sigma factor [Chloroflexota bacterium]